MNGANAEVKSRVKLTPSVGYQYGRAMHRVSSFLEAASGPTPATCENEDPFGRKVRRPSGQPPRPLRRPWRMRPPQLVTERHLRSQCRAHAGVDRADASPTPTGQQRKPGDAGDGDQIRETLESERLFPLCHGASLDVYSIGPIRKMDRGLRAYRLTMGRQVTPFDIVESFGCETNAFASRSPTMARM